ncbi:MAG: TRAP transporter substrate-binding protein DctP [Peptococcaceae bacterium]|jgi:TRAP-type C4-dicarboxylate transport system substrate-binding protein|nr:TRAP transporter substrate-binding protein DctP [Peptococcaceae bacterium]MDH7525390.1 TRAP transporter substrate-binding protein DctP [Peptococcaceae bacterium]
MKKTVIMLLVLALIMALVLPACSSEKKEQAQEAKESPKNIKLTYASYLKEDFSNNLTTKWWMDEVTKRTNGQVVFETYYSGILLKGEELLKGCGRGQADIVLAPDSYTADLTPLSMVQVLPFMSDKMDSYMNAIYEMFTTEPLLLEEFKKNGVHFLAEIPVAANILGAKQNIDSMEKLKGKRIRCMNVIAAVMQKLGAVPVGLPLGDVYDGISKGVIDGYSLTDFTLATMNKLYEVAPYMIDTGMGEFGGMWFVINENKWQSLPEDVKKVMTQVAQEAIQKHVALYEGIESQKVEEAYKGKAKVVIWSEMEKEKLKNTVAQKIWDDWAKDLDNKGLKGTYILNKWKEIVEKHNKESKYVSPYQKFVDKYGAVK